MKVWLILSVMLLLGVGVQAQIEEVDIVVVGAGVAGIKAARDAIDAGYSVVILEAQNRYGGRIRTLRVPGFDYPVEMGAMWYHSSNFNSMLGLAAECNLDLEIYDHGDTKTWQDGVKHTTQDTNGLVGRWLTAWANSEPFAQTGRSDYDAFVLGGYVPHVDRQVETLIRYADEQIYGDNTENHDSLGWQDLGPEGIDQFDPLGYDRVLDCMLDRSPSLRPTLRLQSVVNKIKYETGGSAQVIYRDDGVDDIDLNSETAPHKKINVRKAVIVTVSTGVLKRRAIKFIPDLPASHWHSVDVRLFGNVSKLAAFFDNAGAQKLNAGKYGANYLFRICNGPQPRFEIKPYIFINHQYLTGTPILNSFDQGRVSTQFSQLSKAQLQSIFMNSIREIIPTLPDPIQFEVQHWGLEKYVWGAYTDYGLGTVEADFAIWESPLGYNRNLWFAGEGYTSQNVIGTVSSAFFSAKEVIRQIVAEGLH